jgi:apolipoprotein N-acyltransferase
MLIMSILPAVFSVLLSAVLLSAGIPNEYLKLGSVLLGLFSLVPLYFAFLGTKRQVVAGFLGGLMMMTVHLLSSFWLANFKEYAILTLGGSAMVNFCFGFLAGLLLKHALSFPLHIRPFVFAAVWMIWEWFKSIGFLAYPWGTLVMTSRQLFPLIQIADITGTWGISFLFALVSAVAAETLIAVRARSKLFTPSTAFTLFLLALACVYGIFRIAVQPQPETTLNVVMVQQNTDSWDEGGFKKAILVSEKLTRAAIARSGKKPDLVVWSESTLTYPYLENREYYKVFPPEDPLGPFRRPPSCRLACSRQSENKGLFQCSHPFVPVRGSARLVRQNPARSFCRIYAFYRIQMGPRLLSVARRFFIRLDSGKPA